MMTTIMTTVTQLTRCFDLWQRYHRRSHKPLCNCQTLAWWWLSVMTRIMRIMNTLMMVIRSPAEAVMTHKRDWDDSTDDQIIMKGIVMTAMTMMITTCRCWTQPMLQSLTCRQKKPGHRSAIIMIIISLIIIILIIITMIIMKIVMVGDARWPNVQYTIFERKSDQNQPECHRPASAEEWRLWHRSCGRQASPPPPPPSALWQSWNNN